MKFLRLALLTVLSATIFSSAAAVAQQAIDAPVPSALRTAKKIFVSNGGADSGLFASPFSGDTNRAYNQFYAGLQATRQFELVNDPAQADLVLELQLTAPTGSTRSLEANKVNGAADPEPMFRLVVYDQKTHYVLWTITKSIEIALLQKTHDRNFDDALNRVLSGFQTITGKPSTLFH